MITIKRKYLFLITFILAIRVFSIQSQNEQILNDSCQYWFLQKNDTLLGVNYTELNKKIREENRTPKKSVIVSVVDAGFDFNHSVLKNIVWINKEEITVTSIKYPNIL